MVIVERLLLHQHETMSGIEAIRFTVAQGPDTHRTSQRVGLRKNPSKHRRANPFALMGGTNVQVIEDQALLMRLEHIKAHPLAVHDDMPSMFRRKTGEKALSRSDRIEPTDPLQTFAHGLDAKRGQCRGIRSGCSSKHDGWRWVHEHVPIKAC